MMRNATRVLQTLLALAVAASVTVPFAAMLSGKDIEDELPSGQQTFLDQKCNICHSVQSAGIEAKTKSEKMKGPDLAGITSRRETDWIAKYLLKEVQLDGRDHKKEFKGSKDELAALISWLEGQTPESTEK